MKLIREIQQIKVWDHWKETEGFSNDNFRSDIRNPLPGDLKWYLACLEISDIEKMNIISSADWRDDRLCVPDFKLLTAMSNYKTSVNTLGKYDDIRKKERFLKNDLSAMDTRLIIVAPDIKGPFTIIEGCRRAIALSSLGKLSGLEIFIGISPGIKDYKWTRYSK